MSSPVTSAHGAATRTAVEVRMEGLTRRYGPVVALDGLDLTLQPGELIALLGPSGCGKTTTLRLLAGLEDADAGTITVAGQDITQLPANKRDMGMVFQAYSLFPHMTVVQNVAFGLRLRRMAKDERERRALEMLDLVGLSEQSGRYAHQLSGGQQQRVALARALAIEPQVLLLDEPLSALDAKVRAQLRDEIRRIQLEVGITTLFVTHDQEEALAIADRVGVMRSGQLEQLAPPTEVYSRPATPFVAEFVGLTNRLAGTVSGSVVTVRGRDLPLVDLGMPAGPVTALVRPEAVSLARGEPADVGTAGRHGDRHHLPGRDQPGHRGPGRYHDHGAAADFGSDRAGRRQPGGAVHPARPGAGLPRRRAGCERGLSGGPPPLTTVRRLEAGPVLRHGASTAYRAVEFIDGERHVVRDDFAMEAGAVPAGAVPAAVPAGAVRPGRPSPPRPAAGEGAGRPLACLVHITDLQLADVQSPTRFEFLNRYFADPRYAGLVPVQRPQEAITPHAVEAMLRTINGLRGPVTGQPLQLAVTTGDAIDNAQWNEVQAFLALFDGGLVRPGSGGPRYAGVQALEWPDDIFWKPDGAGPRGADFFRREFGFPHCPGLLEAAMRPFSAPGPGCTVAVLLRQPRGAQPGRRGRHAGPCWPP